MQALQSPNCAGVLVPTGRAPRRVAASILSEGLADWGAYWRARATAVPRLPQLRRERGAAATLLPAESNQRLATNHLTLPLTILWAAREHGIDLQSFVGDSKRSFRVHVVGAEEETEGRNAEVLREIALLLPEIQCEVTLLGPGMADHAPGWITHEGLTVNGRKGLYHDLLPPASAATAADGGGDDGGVDTQTQAAVPQKGKAKTVITTIMPAGLEAGQLAAPDLALLINAGVYEYGSWFPSLAALAAHGFPATITSLSHLDHACSRSFLAALARGEATLLPGAIDEKSTTEAERAQWSKKGNGSMCAIFCSPAFPLSSLFSSLLALCLSPDMKSFLTSPRSCTGGRVSPPRAATRSARRTSARSAKGRRLPPATSATSTWRRRRPS